MNGFARRLSALLAVFLLAGSAWAASADDNKVIFPGASAPGGAAGSSGGGGFGSVSLVIALLIAAAGAWFMWRGYYWSRVPGIGGKARVGFDWFLNLLFGSDPVQLKVEDDAATGMGPSGRRRPVPRRIDPRG